ncbi:Pre-mRNA splicing factor PRP21 like protein-domain-containing protein [Pavlovales sp. CCMP2436]|nr:Pre-mRNA splicing factor PRP21 like protein-domain-containing protein [Pavlovales sp. CCMP2436]
MAPTDAVEAEAYQGASLADPEEAYPGASMAEPEAMDEDEGAMDTVPAEIKTIIDKTALYVARNGPDFEAMIVKNNAANPKFSFLKPSDPFYAHYRKVVEQNGGPLASAVAAVAEPPPPGGEVEEEEGGAQPNGAQPDGKGAGGAQTAKASTVRSRVVPLALPERQYHVPRVPGMLHKDVDTIMLAAQFVARNGRRFLSRLTQREEYNPQFDFLRPQHYLFGFFTSLVDAYSKCILAPQDVLETVSAHTQPEAPVLLLARLRQHAEWQLVEEKTRVDRQNADDAERMQLLSIDWHDFVVVETIAFEADAEDEEELPAASRLETDVGGDEAAKKKEAHVETVPLPPAPAEPDEGLAVPDYQPAEPAMKIRRDYVPDVRASSARPAVQMAIDPISGKEVPVSEIGEHLRISLLDPRWKEQKEIAAEKQKESNVAKGDEVFANLSRLADRRTDIFGDEEGAIGEVNDPQQRKLAKAANDRVIWDGHAESVVHAAILAHSKGANAVPDDYSAASFGPPPGFPMGFPPPPMMTMPMPPQGMPPPGLLPGMTPMMLPPPGMMMMMPPPGLPPGMAFPGNLMAPPAPPDDSNPAKRQRLPDEPRMLVGEEAFLEIAENDTTITLFVQVPFDQSKPEWNLEGQTLELVLHVRESVATLKEKLCEALGNMPVSKVQVTGSGLPVFKDKDSLAVYNLTTGEALVLKLKTRGGR